MPSSPDTVVVIGTGGTIAGSAARADEAVDYRAGALSAAQLLQALPALGAVQALSVAAVDSKDMDAAVWQALHRACREQLARPEVAGIVITHGTDTLEETAYLLHRTLAADKPVVLTAAMRPASALSPDGPQNLLDAVTLARTPGVRGVLVVAAGRVHAGAELRKLHGFQVDTFSSGDAGPLARIDNGRLQRFRAWPAEPLHGADLQALPAPQWPPVDIVTSHAGARAATLQALVQAGARGIVIAGTGNGTVHQALLQATLEAAAQGVPVRRASRCILGGVVDSDADPALPSAGTLTPPQARIELMLDLMLPAGVGPTPPSA